MNRQNKQIKTQKIKKLECLDRAVWLLPPIICILLLHRGIGNIIRQMREDFLTGLLSLVAVVIMLGIFYVPAMMVWRAVSRTLKRSAIENTTFPVLENFDYFRDELTGISPATISMCVDYEIERDKDLAAQLLKFTMDGLIEIEGQQIKVLSNRESPKELELSVSEQFLIASLEEGSLTEPMINQWADLAKQEVLEGPYIKTMKEKKKAKATGCLGCLPFFLMMIVAVVVINSSCVKLLMTLAETNSDMSNKELFQLMAQDPRYAIGAVALTLVGIAVFASMIFPFSRTLAEYLQWKKKTPYRRTSYGEVLAEEIYGLKNFIHDFSDLEHAQKETLILWDDFLIYAVILEENTSIVNEITAMRNLTIIKPEHL